VFSRNDHDRGLDSSAHLLSGGLVSQPASVTCCTLTQVVALFVLHAKLMLSRLLVLSVTCSISELKHVKRTSRGRVLVYKLFSYFKHDANAICTSVSFCFSRQNPAVLTLVTLVSIGCVASKGKSDELERMWKEMFTSYLKAHLHARTEENHETPQ
jgi:hypothetical protein